MYTSLLFYTFASAGRDSEGVEAFVNGIQLKEAHAGGLHRLLLYKLTTSIICMDKLCIDDLIIAAKKHGLSFNLLYSSYGELTVELHDSCHTIASVISYDVDILISTCCALITRYSLKKLHS